MESMEGEREVSCRGKTTATPGDRLFSCSFFPSTSPSVCPDNTFNHATQVYSRDQSLVRSLKVFQTRNFSHLEKKIECYKEKVLKEIKSEKPASLPMLLVSMEILEF